MRKQLFNTFKLPRFTNNLRQARQYFHQNPKAAFNFSAAMLLASSATLFAKSLNDTVKNAENNNTQEPVSAEQSSQVEFTPLTEEKYNEAIKNKKDVLIFCNPNIWKEDLVAQVEGILNSLQMYNTQMKGRKLVVFTINIENKEQLAEFREKFKADIQRETFFLLKNRYSDQLKEFTLDDWFDNQRSLYAYFKRLQRLTPQNFDKFKAALPNFDSEGRVVFAYIPKDSPDYKKKAREFGKLAIHFASAPGGDVNCFLVNDPEVAKKLGANPEQGGKVFMLNKTNKYNGFKGNINLDGNRAQVNELPIEVGMSLDEIKPKLSQFYRENFVFMKSDFDEINPDYTLVLQINENKINKNDLAQCVEVMGDVHHELKTNKPELFNDFKFVKYKQSMPDKAFRIYIQDNKNRTQDVYLKYYNKKPLTEEQLKKLDGKSHSFEYEFPQDLFLSKENVLKFVEEVKQGKVPENFVGQAVPLTQKYSTKIVEDTYKRDILDVDKDHVVFLCTKHCPGCKFMGKFYEKFAFENLKNPNSTIQFNRINSEKNTLSHLPNYPYTPVFLILKKEDRTKPIVYRPTTGHPDALRDFIEVTTGHQWIDKKVEQELFYETKPEETK